MNPDLFLTERLNRDAYAAVIDLFVERQVNPPTAPATFHAAIARAEHDEAPAGFDSGGGSARLTSR